VYRHNAEYRQLSRIDTAVVPTRRRFCSHRRLSSRRRQRRLKSTTCEWHAGSQVIDKLSASLRHFIRFLLSSSHVPRLLVKVTAGHNQRPLRIIADHPSIRIRPACIVCTVFCQSVPPPLSCQSLLPRDAYMCIARYCHRMLSVRLSLMLMICGHVCWVASKVIIYTDS